MARGGYTITQINQMTEEEIFFLYHYQNLDRKNFIDDIATILGVLWTPSTYLEHKDKKEEDIGDILKKVTDKKVIVPLSVAINPKILDFVKKQGIDSEAGRFAGTVAQGDYNTNKGEKVVSLASLPKEEFKKIMGRGIKHAPTEAPKKPKKNTSSFN